MAGVRTSVSTQVRHNGELVSTKKNSSRVTTKPKNAVVLRGTKEVRSVFAAGSPPTSATGVEAVRRSSPPATPTGTTHRRDLLRSPGRSFTTGGGHRDLEGPDPVAVRAGRFDSGTGSTCRS